MSLRSIITRPFQAAPSLRAMASRPGTYIIRPPVLIPLAVLLATWVGFQQNAGLYLRGTLPPPWYDATLIAALILPALIGHLTAWLNGYRSAFWWMLWIPALTLYWLRPWHSGSGWAFFWREHLDLWRYVMEIVRLQERAPLRSYIRLTTGLTMAMVTFMVLARSWLRFTAWLREIGRDSGDGAGPAGAGKAEGLPQATWASAAQVRKQFSHKRGIVLGEHTDPLEDSRDFDPEKPGSWNGQGKGRLITMDPKLGNGHVVVLAASAGYKTAGLVIPNILNYNGPLVVIDPKGDLYARTRAAREAMGFTARVIDARNGFDPFRVIAPLAPEAPSVYLTMARTLMPLSDRASDISEYFHEMSTALFAALMAHFISEGSDNVAGDISAFINRKRDVVIEEAQYIAERHKFPFVSDELEGLAALDERTFPGVVKGISNKLAFTRFPDVASYGQSGDSPDTHLAALDPKSDIFINFPTLAANDFSSFPRLLIGAIYVASELIEQPDRPRARRLFLVDEARVLGGMDALNNIRDAGRSIGLHLMLIYQNYGQLTKAWGGEAGAAAWLDSCEARVISAVGSSRTANDIITMLGRRTLRTRVQGSSASNPVMTPMGGTVSSSEQEQLREVSLMSAATLGQLPAHGSLIFTRRSKPILATKAIYFTRPKMAARVKSPDEVTDELDATRRRKAVMDEMRKRALKDLPDPQPGLRPRVWGQDKGAADADSDDSAPDTDTELEATPAAPQHQVARQLPEADESAPAQPTTATGGRIITDLQAKTRARIAAALAAKKDREDHERAVVSADLTAPDPAKQEPDQNTDTDLAAEPDARPSETAGENGRTSEDHPDESEPVEQDEQHPEPEVTASEQNEPDKPAEKDQAFAGRPKETTEVASVPDDPQRHHGADEEQGAGQIAAEPSDDHTMDAQDTSGSTEEQEPEGSEQVRKQDEPDPITVSNGSEAADGSDTTGTDPETEASNPTPVTKIDPDPTARSDAPQAEQPQPDPESIDAQSIPNAEDPENESPTAVPGNPEDSDEAEPDLADLPDETAEAICAPDDPEAELLDLEIEAALEVIGPKRKRRARKKATEAKKSGGNAEQDNAGETAVHSTEPQENPAPSEGQGTNDPNAQEDAAAPEAAKPDTSMGDGAEQKQPSSTDPSHTSPAKGAQAKPRASARKKTPRKDDATSKRRRGLDADDVREAFDPHIEAFFRAFYGDPVQPGAHEWRPRDRDGFSLQVRGTRRGCWKDFVSNSGGSIFDLVAIHLCDLPKAKADFPRVLEAAADYAGFSPARETPKTRKARAERKTKQDRAAQAEDQRKSDETAMLVLALRALTQPVAGSLSERYLAHRAITDWPETGLGFLPALDTQLPAPALDLIHSPQYPSLVVWAVSDAGTITGGQRILLDKSGKGLRITPAKPSFGRIKACPARFPATRPSTLSGPLLVAEGPETALTLHAATGHESWAVFGVSGWQSVPLPTGRDILLAPDRDAPDSPAGIAFRKAVAQHLDRDCTLRIAPTPAPDDSRKDLNDIAMDQGLDAVRTALDAARPPGPDDLPKPEEDSDAQDTRTKQAGREDENG